MGKFRGAVAPLLSMILGNTKDEYIEIKTQYINNFLKNTMTYTLPLVAPTAPPTSYIHQLRKLSLLKILWILLKNTPVLHYMKFFLRGCVPQPLL